MQLNNISIYPLKSGKEINLKYSQVLLNGLKYDRNFAVIDNQNKIVTAREFPKLLKIKQEVDKDKISLYINDSKLEINTANSYDSYHNTDIIAVLFNKKIKVTRLKFAEEWVSQNLNSTYRFICLKKDISNLMDDSPIHLINQSSLIDLNSRLDNSVHIENFRPNFVVSGFEAYSEDKWSQIKIGECLFKVVKKCVRCSLSSINRKTGKKEKEPLKTLSKYRRDNNEIYFGIYLKPIKKGIVNIGDKIEIII